MDLLLTRTPDSNGNQKDTDEYVKLSLSNEKVASDNFEALQSLHVPTAQVNSRYSCSAASKLASDDMGGLESKLFVAKWGKSNAYEKSLDQKRFM